jgi:glutaminase
VRTLAETLVAPAELAAHLTFIDLDAALEHCEDVLLGDLRTASTPTRRVTLAEHSLCQGMPAADVAVLEGLLEERRFTPGQVIVHRGQRADELFLLLEGEVSVMIDLASGRQKRVSTMSPGMTFGELAAVARALRSADVRADLPVRCLALSTTALAELGQTHPRICLAIQANLLRTLALMIARLNQEIASLAE